MPGSTVSPKGSRTFVDLDGAWEMRAEGEWVPVDVPSNWHGSGLPNHTGEVWYRRAFQKRDDLGAGAWWLRFDGVDYFCDVYLNGTLLGHHEGYFQPFEYEVGALLQDENELQVRVDAPREEPGTVWPTRKRLIKGVLNHHDCRPGANDPRWGQDGSTGGIWNSVSLYSSARQRLHHVHITTHRVADGAAVTVRCELQNLEGRPRICALHLDLLDAEGLVVARQGRQVTVTAGRSEHYFVVTLETWRAWETWDRGGPYRYAWRLQLRDAEAGPWTSSPFEPATALDAAEGRFGIREVALDEGWRWTLNGRRFFPRGTNIIPTQWLASYRPQDIERDVALLLEANVNLVRVHAHVTRPEFYTACDEAGILVWQDFPLQWGYQESDAFRAEAMSQIRDMVRLLCNHPSLAVWCCHNEPTHNRWTLDPLLEAAVREVDSSRPVVAASDFKQHPYPGWYYGHVEHYRGLPAAPFVSEYGAQALPDADALRDMLGDAAWPPDWERWAYHDFQHDQTFRVAGISQGDSLEAFVRNSQAYQFRLIKMATEIYRAHKYEPITGVLQFMFVDCWPAITWAVLDHARRPKKGFQALKMAFQPVLVSLLAGQGMDRGTLETGSVWSALTLCSPVIVNDRLESYEHARLEVSMLRGDQRWLLDARTLDVPPDAVVRPPSPMELLETPDKEGWKEAWRPVLERFNALEPGTYQVHLSLTTHDGLPLSSNFEEVELVAPVVPSPFQL